MPTLTRRRRPLVPVASTRRKPILDHRAISIAESVATTLHGTTLDGPDGRLLVIQAALACPLIRSEYQAQAVADGWEGHIENWRKAARFIRVCRSAGRQLVYLLEVRP